MKTFQLASYEEYQRWRVANAEQRNQRSEQERLLVQHESSFTTEGFCQVCRKWVPLLVDFLYSPEPDTDAPRIPNWRERLVCPECNLNNRTRACIHFFTQKLGATAQDSIFLTEQVTPLYQYLRAVFPRLVASEYLGDDIAPGTTHPETGIRNESVTKLSFEDSQFDYVLSFDVIEHVPDYRKAFAECRRVLRSNGVLLFSVPFDANAKSNLVRATIDSSGQVHHLLPPEYHGDPINQKGCLCFYHFGWQMLKELRECGFSSAKAHLYWSDTFGYLGGDQMLFTATA